MQRIKEELKKRLSSSKNIEFTLIINNKLVMIGNYIGRVEYHKAGKETKIRMGHRKKEGNLFMFNECQEIEDEINAEFNNTNIAGIDFEPLSSRDFKIEVYKELKIVEITTAMHLQYLSILKSSGNALQFAGKGGATFSLTVGEIINFKDEYGIEMYFRYRDLCKNYLLKSIMRFKNRTFSEVRFYKTLKSFVPVIIEAPFLFNPFTEIPSIANMFKSSKLYKECMATETVVCGNIGIHFLTHLEISKALRLDKFVEFNWQFLTLLLAGKLFGNIADEHTIIYKVEREYRDYVKEPIMSPYAYENSDVQHYYAPITTLQYACDVTLHQRDANKIYNIIKNYEL